MTLVEEYRDRFYRLFAHIDELLSDPSLETIMHVLEFLEKERKEIQQIQKQLFAEAPPGLTDAELAELMKRGELAMKKINGIFKSYQLFLNIMTRLLTEQQGIGIDFQLKAIRAATPMTPKQRESFVESYLTFIDTAEEVIRKADIRLAKTKQVNVG